MQKLRSIFFKLRTSLIKLFQSTFHRVETLGAHQLNNRGVWKADYKLLYKSVYDNLRIKLDHYSANRLGSHIVLPSKLYAEEYKELEDKLLSNKNLLDTLDIFFGGREWKIGPPVCWRLKLMKKMPSKKDQEEGARFWHLDAVRHDYLKLFINLMDIEDNHGPLSVISVEQSKKIIKFHKTTNRYELKDKEFEADIIKASGPIGTATFCTTSRCLHRGGYQAPNYQRDVIQVHFVLKKPIFGLI